MSNYGNPDIDRLVKIDDNHALFLQALVTCKKPRHVLEFGFGAGEATRAILAGLNYNGWEYRYTVVDNWMDFNGQQPDATGNEIYKGVNFTTSNELDFVVNCTQAYDFIMSDADHNSTQDWFDIVYERLLARSGVLVYHDVTNAALFPNLLRIYEDCIRKNYHHVLLNRNSLASERCDRGMLVIFKP